MFPREYLPTQGRDDKPADHETDEPTDYYPDGALLNEAFDYLYQHHTDVLSSLINASDIASSPLPNYEPYDDNVFIDYDPDGEAGDTGLQDYYDDKL